MLNFLRHIKHSARRTLFKLLSDAAKRKVYNKTKGTVLAGPFEGLKLVNKNVFGSEIPKLLGCYEKELTTSLLNALARQPKSVCNIGAAEGYYALGCARYQGIEQVLIFEALESGRLLINDNLKSNQIRADVTINGLCDEQTLWNTLTSNSIDLMLIDIEGAELDILSSRNIELLDNTEVIIESHDFCRPDCIDRLKQLFKATHDINVIGSESRTTDDFPSEISLPAFLKLELMDEKRPGTMQWLIGTPKANN